MSGRLVVVGLGPGDTELVSPAVSVALCAATDLVGYHRYLDRVPDRAGQERHPSDNRVERERARLALSLASEGRRVALVSSGDPGVFAMAAAVYEVLEEAPSYSAVEVEVLPGVTAMLAAAARVGAPLGHDFCAINMSCNLKPWTLLQRRIEAALHGDFVMAFYNPRSKARPHELHRALELIRGQSHPERPVVFARAVSTTAESIRVVPIRTAVAEMADMRTMVIVGSSATKTLQRGARTLVYTPRAVPA